MDTNARIVQRLETTPAPLLSRPRPLSCAEGTPSLAVIPSFTIIDVGGLMTRGKAVGLLLLGLVLPLPALAQAGAGNVRAEIEKVGKSWEKAYNAGDAATVAALYAPDAKLLAPGSEPGTDSKAIEKIIAAGIALGGKLTLTTEDVVGFGDYAVETGKWVANSTDGKHLDHGSFLAVYKKTKGGWKYYRDTWNSSMSNK